MRRIHPFSSQYYLEPRIVCEREDLARALHNDEQIAAELKSLSGQGFSIFFRDCDLGSFATTTHFAEDDSSKFVISVDRDADPKIWKSDVRAILSELPDRGTAKNGWLDRIWRKWDFYFSKQETNEELHDHNLLYEHKSPSAMHFRTLDSKLDPAVEAARACWKNDPQLQKLYGAITDKRNVIVQSSGKAETFIEQDRYGTLKIRLGNVNIRAQDAPESFRPVLKSLHEKNIGGQVTSFDVEGAVGGYTFVPKFRAPIRNGVFPQHSNKLLTAQADELHRALSQHPPSEPGNILRKAAPLMRDYLDSREAKLPFMFSPQRRALAMLKPIEKNAHLYPPGAPRHYETAKCFAGPEPSMQWQRSHSLPTPQQRKPKKTVRFASQEAYKHLFKPRPEPYQHRPLPQPPKPSPPPRLASPILRPTCIPRNRESISPRPLPPLPKQPNAPQPPPKQPFKEAYSQLIAEQKRINAMPPSLLPNRPPQAPSPTSSPSSFGSSGSSSTLTERSFSPRGSYAPRSPSNASLSSTASCATLTNSGLAPQKSYAQCLREEAMQGVPKYASSPMKDESPLNARKRFSRFSLSR